MKKTRSADFCADRIDVITSLAVITNAIIKRVHCSWISKQCRSRVGGSVGHVLKFCDVCFLGTFKE